MLHCGLGRERVVCEAKTSPIRGGRLPSPGRSDVVAEPWESETELCRPSQIVILANGTNRGRNQPRVTAVEMRSRQTIAWKDASILDRWNGDEQPR